MLPTGTRPSRESVISAVEVFNSRPGTWHSLRRPSLDSGDIEFNRGLIDKVGLTTANFQGYGRKSFRSLELPISQVLEEILFPWHLRGSSPDWRHDDICSALERLEDRDELVTVIRMERSDGSPRIRQVDELGFVNLFQGEDTIRVSGQPFYPGDRKIPIMRGEVSPPITLQVHLVAVRNTPEVVCDTLAIRLGERSIIRRRSQ